jgi:pimeloyl-ACP methyl ester carboxylesterase
LSNGAFLRYLEAWVKSDISTEIAGKQLPVMVIIGAHDEALNAKLMRATYLKWYPNAQLSTIADAGHYPVEETPVILAALIERFLRQVV